MLEELSSKDKVVGLKQVQRAVSAGRAGWVFLACDADPRLTRPLEGRCRERGCNSTIWIMTTPRSRAAGATRSAAGTTSRCW